VVQEMASRAREENEALKQKIADLETKIEALAKPARSTSRTSSKK